MVKLIRKIKALLALGERVEALEEGFARGADRQEDGAAAQKRNEFAEILDEWLNGEVS